MHYLRNTSRSLGRRLLIIGCVLLLSACAELEPRPLFPQTFERPMVWSGVRYTGGEDPHAYGLEVELWKRGSEIVGFIEEYVGPPADAPAGRVESINFDEKTGALSFVAKLSVGVVLSEDGKSWVPARNEFEFLGNVNEETLTGVLQRRTVLPNGRVTTEKEEITLERDPAAHDTPVTHADWLETWNTVLRARGPRW